MPSPTQRTGARCTAIDSSAATLRPCNRLGRSTTPQRESAFTGGAAYLSAFILVVAMPETKPRQRAWVLPVIDPITRKAALGVTVSF